MMRRLLLLCLPCHHDKSPILEELVVALSQEGRWFVWDCAGVDFVWRLCFARQVACIDEGCLE